MSNRRTRLKIYFDILKAIIRGNKRKTRIMHAVYISENKLKEMLTFLISHGFVEEVKTLHWRDKRIITSYKCTTKGEKTVSYLEQYEVFLEEMDLEERIKEKYSHME